MTVLGKGAFGCVVSPPLKCTDSSIKMDNGVSKIMEERDVLEEMKEYKLLDKMPELKKYLLKFPLTCKPINDDKFHKAVKQCNHKNINRVYNKSNTDKISSLLLENGGVSLADFYKLFKKLTVNDFEIFLTSIKDLFQALIILRKYKCAHLDIKSQNIVYSPKTGKIALIDFGKLTSFRRMKRYSQHDANFDGVTHFNYPPEAKYMNKSQNPLKTKSELDYSEFLDNTILSWDSYSLALCLSQQFNGFSHILDYIIKDKTKNKIISTFLRDADSLVQSYIEFDKMSSNELETYIGNGGKHLRNQDLEHLRDEYIALLKDSKIYKDTNPKPSKEVIEIAKANSIQYMVEKK